MRQAASAAPCTRAATSTQSSAPPSRAAPSPHGFKSGREREGVGGVEGVVIPKGGANPRADIQRPSMGEDIIKGRRTEIEQMNGLIARKGAEIGVPAPSHAKLTELVTKIERGQLKPSPAHLGG